MTDDKKSQETCIAFITTDQSERDMINNAFIKQLKYQKNVQSTRSFLNEVKNDLTVGHILTYEIPDYFWSVFHKDKNIIDELCDRLNIIYDIKIFDNRIAFICK